MLLFATFLLIHLVSAHSWLECTKYTGDLEDFEKDKCGGLPRPLPGNRNVGDTFGADIGMDFRPQTGGARCQGDATTGTPTQVQYEAGKTYTLAWAPKNHVAAECTNAFIPDAFLRVYMHPYDGVSDPTQEEFKENQVKASFSDDPHVSGQIDLKGFQNCPKFCENTDKALCTGTITIPTTAALGVHTFQWYWAFNSETDLYATCWEAEVIANTGGDDDDDSSGTTPTTGPEVTTTTTTFAPCDDCCDATEIVAPGTADMMMISPIPYGEYEWFDCPEGFSGEIKMFCMEDGISSEPRIFDGYCEPMSSAANVTDEKNQDGAVAGLSVALTFTILAFCLYVAFTQGWIDADTFSSTNKGDQQLGSHLDYEAPISPRKAPQEIRTRVKSVFTESKTELPVLPETPEWHYVNENDETIGPVTTQAVSQWAKKIGVEVSLQTYVWNGTTVKDWTSLSDVPQLREAVKKVQHLMSE